MAARVCRSAARAAGGVAASWQPAAATPAHLAWSAYARGVATAPGPPPTRRAPEGPFVTELESHPPAAQRRIPTYGVLDEHGALRPGAVVDPDLTQELVLRAYRTMTRNLVMDALYFEAQRQGRISFYLTSFGEEASSVGSAMALQPEDTVFAQYREVGVLLWRGMPLSRLADQLLATEDDLGKGRQMPIHYGSRELYFQTISSPLGTQIPQAAGSAYANKLAGNGRIAACYFGEGAASEGDAHAGFNIAATTGSPVLFFVRNNGWAISTPSEEQFRGDGIAPRAIALGMHALRVDGNDLLAVYAATKAARAIAAGGQPVLVEAMGYRESHHSTSDDSTKYRPAEEIRGWRERYNPLVRLRKHLYARGWWSEAQEEALVASERTLVLEAMAAAEAKPKPALGTLFTDVYSPEQPLPRHLAAQRAELEAFQAKQQARRDAQAAKQG